MKFTNDSFLSQWQRVVLRFPLRAERIQDQKDSVATILLVHRGLRSSQWSRLLCSGLTGPVGPPLETSLRTVVSLLSRLA